MAKGKISMLLTGLLLLALCAGLLPAAPANAQDAEVDVDAIFEAMSIADRVGQLFVVSFAGTDTAPDSEIAELIRDYRIGGVILSSEAGNFRNRAPDGARANAPEQIVRLANQLQTLAFDGTLPGDATLSPSTDAVQRLAVPDDRGVTLPLLIGINHEGDGFPFTQLTDGFTPLPSNMALGATWNPVDAGIVGHIAGKELAAVGINLLLGPSLDVLDNPGRAPQSSLGTRSFGGSSYWVGRLGRAFIGGVHDGSNGRVATLAKHFPGQGSSDRLPDEEVATIQKTAEELEATELVPFAAVVKPGTVAGLLAPGGNETDAEAPSRASTTTDGLLSTHVRYASVQGGGEGTPPISLAPQLGQVLLENPAFSDWRKDQGIVMSDALGAPAVRRHYDPALQTFPHKRIAQEALLAGNDLLLLSRFDLNDDWPSQLTNIKETVLFFQDKYATDPAFQRRVDESVRRIIRLKGNLYPELNLRSTLVDGAEIRDRIGQDTATVAQIARDAITLIAPSRVELAERMPTGPGANENILIFTDSRVGRECAEADCPAFPLIAPTALEEIILSLYGPAASGQVTPERIESLTFEQLSAYLSEEPTDPSAEEIERLIAEADWLVFALLNDDPTVPSGAALRQFLSLRPESRERKRLVAIAFNAPYYLDATDIAKLTVFMGAYGKTAPFLEASVRALFREFSPTGASPVDISGINYSVTNQLKPDPTRAIELRVPDVQVALGSNTFTAAVGDTLRVVAGPILDYNGRLVPDGTEVNFKLRQRGDQFELPLESSGTVDGFAEASIILERAGDFEVQVTSGAATGSLSLVLNIVDEAEGEAQVAVATATATPTREPTATPTATASPTETATPTATLLPTATPTPILPLPPKRVDGGSLALSLLSIVLVGLATFFLFGAATQVPDSALRNVLLAAVGGLIAYSLYGLGLLPGATWLQRQLRPWGAALVTVIGCLVPLLLIMSRQRQRQ